MKVSPNPACPRERAGDGIEAYRVRAASPSPGPEEVPDPFTLEQACPVREAGLATRTEDGYFATTMAVMT